MGPSLLLSLLLLPTCLQAGSSEECDLKTGYGIEQPNHLSAPMGGSVHIPFSFYYCWKLAKDPRVSIALSREHFHAQFIYNSTQPFIHEEYKNRISLNLSMGQKFGSLCISNLRKEDANVYFCRIQVKTLRHGTQVWQSVQGTRLTVTYTAERTTEGPTTTGLSVLEGTGSSASSPPSVGAVVIVALAGVVIKTAILGLILYLRWKRGKVFNHNEAQDNSGILYASLTLSSSSSPAASPCIPPKESPQEETLYSLIKA
uniref:paired immunoglobulin-like type 2 receptor beta n=1 Tax=Odobenus rosmarus divergens TaxID=9708 RepID=UPI00063CF9ED|nr:PREDICTED: paired immunoglobulin-like type 2 receptor beta [Odobenus rosmarus divergens]